MTIDILNRLKDSGELEILVKNGLIPFNILEWIKIHNSVEFLKKNGSKQKRAIEKTSEIFSISERQVYRIIHKFK